MKKNTKTLVAIFTGASLATMLVACTPNKSIEPQKKENVETVQEREIADIREDIIDESFSEEYFEQLKKDLEEVKEYGKEKWDSEEVKEKRENIKTKFRELVDFVFNGKEINGVTFSELKTKEKEKIIKHLLELDEYIDDYIPEYKERLKNWLSEEGHAFREWIIDKSVDAKELWDDFKNDVKEEYEDRQKSKQI